MESGHAQKQIIRRVSQNLPNARRLAIAGGAVRSQGDADTDFDIDGADFLTWQRQLNAVEATVATVPEPAALTLVAAGMASTGALRRRRS